MYTVTFYSFKGGVGRTLAMVNVAVEFARAGKRVLIVDFDLEAPGIHTFQLLRPDGPSNGVVEFVSDYIRTSVAPDVRDYCYKAKLTADIPGEIWVMPSGRGGAAYSRSLGLIDWERLYSQQDGYLLMEDLREQWRGVISPDYVLIDSRTGHTDIAGICTRQLPDAVAFLFFPNEQNLAGLTEAVQAVRSEGDGPRKKSIALHFVVSNVPDLDDENSILQSRMAEFRTQLQYEELAATIHHYDSLALLNQVVFTAERPKSRLAREYRELRNSIAGNNLEDRDSAKRILERYLSSPPWTGTQLRKNFEERFRAILQFHSQDDEILFLLAMVQKRAGRSEEAFRLLEKISSESLVARPQYLLEKAELRLSSKDPAGAALDVELALSKRGLDEDGIERAVILLRKADPEWLANLPNQLAVSSLDDTETIAVAAELRQSPLELRVSTELLEPLRRKNLGDEEEMTSVVHELMMSYIGLSRFDDAIRTYGITRPEPKELSIELCFNYAMALWGRDGAPPEDFCQHVVDLNAAKPDADVRHSDANYQQCLAVVFWVLGQNDNAQSRISRAERIIDDRPEQTFSCWRYLNVGPEEFLQDCEQIRQLIDGTVKKPAFMRNQLIN